MPIGEDAFKRARIAKLHYVAKLEALLVVEVGSPAIGVFPAGEKGGLEPGPRQRWTPDGEGSVEEVLYVAPRRQLVVARSVGPFGVYDVKWGAAVPLRRVEFEAPSELHVRRPVRRRTARAAELRAWASWPEPRGEPR